MLEYVTIDSIRKLEHERKIIEESLLLASHDSNNSEEDILVRKIFSENIQIHGLPSFHSSLSLQALHHNLGQKSTRHKIVKIDYYNLLVNFSFRQDLKKIPLTRHNFQREILYLKKRHNERRNLQRKILHFPLHINTQKSTQNIPCHFTHGCHNIHLPCHHCHVIIHMSFLMMRFINFNLIPMKVPVNSSFFCV